MTIDSKERIAVCTDASKIPVSFRWRGRTFRIDSIERIWRDPMRFNNGQRLYRIRCRRHAFLLRYDRRLQLWSLVRSPLRLRLTLMLTGISTRLAA